MKKVLLCDYDGVLGGDIGGIAFVERLKSAGIFPEQAYRRFRERVNAYGRGETDYYTMLIELTGIYNEALTGERVKRVRDIALSHVRHERESAIYPHTEELLKLFDNYFRIMVTASAQEVMRPLGKWLGMNVVIGTEKRARRGKYDFDLKRSMFGDYKLKHAQEAMKTRRLTFEGSVGFGNAENDLPFLEKVAYPFIVNPTDRVKLVAERNEWPIIDKANYGDIVHIVKERLGLNEGPPANAHKKFAANNG